MGKLRVHNIEAQTGTNVDLGAAGDVVTFASDSIQTNLYKDSGGNTLFQSDGAGTLSNVNSSFSGAGPKLILSQTASNSASISFTSGIDSTYDQYMFVFVKINPATDNVKLQFNLSTDGGSNYNVYKTTTYFNAYHQADDGAASLSYTQGSDLANATGVQSLANGIGNTSNECGSGILYLFAPSSTTYVKHFYSRASIVEASPAANDIYVAGYCNTNSAINAIQFTMSSGNFDGTIKLYGVS